ncbi:hypothetical protein EJB05_49879, partial [Eragrostis curvula]
MQPAGRSSAPTRQVVRIMLPRLGIGSAIHVPHVKEQQQPVEEMTPPPAADVAPPLSDSMEIGKDMMASQVAAGDKVEEDQSAVNQVDVMEVQNNNALDQQLEDIDFARECDVVLSESEDDGERPTADELAAIPDASPSHTGSRHSKRRSASIDEVSLERAGKIKAARNEDEVAMASVESRIETSTPKCQSEILGLGDNCNPHGCMKSCKALGGIKGTCIPGPACNCLFCGPYGAQPPQQLE